MVRRAGNVSDPDSNPGRLRRSGAVRSRKSAIPNQTTNDPDSFEMEAESNLAVSDFPHLPNSQETTDTIMDTLQHTDTIPPLDLSDQPEVVVLPNSIIPELGLTVVDINHFVELSRESIRQNAQGSTQSIVTVFEPFWGEVSFSDNFSRNPFVIEPPALVNIFNISLIKAGLSQIVPHPQSQEMISGYKSKCLDILLSNGVAISEPHREEIFNELFRVPIELWMLPQYPDAENANQILLTIQRARIRYLCMKRCNLPVVEVARRFTLTEEDVEERHMTLVGNGKTPLDPFTNSGARPRVVSIPKVGENTVWSDFNSMDVDTGVEEKRVKRDSGDMEVSDMRDPKKVKTLAEMVELPA